MSWICKSPAKVKALIWASSRSLPMKPMATQGEWYLFDIHICELVKICHEHVMSPKKVTALIQAFCLWN